MPSQWHVYRHQGTSVYSDTYNRDIMWQIRRLVLFHHHFTGRVGRSLPFVSRNRLEGAVVDGSVEVAVIHAYLSERDATSRVGPKTGRQLRIDDVADAGSIADAEV